MHPQRNCSLKEEAQETTISEKESSCFDLPNHINKMAPENGPKYLPSSDESMKPKRKCKGHKGKARERSIKQVVELVKNWRGLSDGSLRMDPRSKVIKHSAKRKTPLSRSSAAQKIGIPKKSLDDYLLLLR
jgi:hypothetical protein